MPDPFSELSGHLTLSVQWESSLYAASAVGRPGATRSGVAIGLKYIANGLVGVIHYCLSVRDTNPNAPSPLWDSAQGDWAILCILEA